jgi:hypothetical protein
MDSMDSMDSKGGEAVEKAAMCALDAAVLAKTCGLPWRVLAHRPRMQREPMLDGQRYVAVAAYDCDARGVHTRRLDGSTGKPEWHVGRLAWCEFGRRGGGGVRWYAVDPDIPGVYHEEKDPHGGAAYGLFAWHAIKTPLFPLYGVTEVGVPGQVGGAPPSIVLPSPVDVLAQEFGAPPRCLPPSSPASPPSPASPSSPASPPPPLGLPRELVPSSGWTFWDTPLVSAASWLLAAAAPVRRGPGLKYKVFEKRACKAKAAVNDAIRLVVDATFGGRPPMAAAVLDTRDLFTTKAVGAALTWIPNFSSEEAAAITRAARPARHDTRLGDVRVLCMALGTFLQRHAAAEGLGPGLAGTTAPPAPLEVLCADYTSIFATFAAQDLHFAATTPGVLAAKAVVTVTASIRNAKTSSQKGDLKLKMPAAAPEGLQDVTESLGRAKTAVVVQFYDVFARAGWHVAVKTVVNYGTMVFVAAEVTRH